MIAAFKKGNQHKQEDLDQADWKYFQENSSNQEKRKNNHRGSYKAYLAGREMDKCCKEWRSPGNTISVILQEERRKAKPLNMYASHTEGDKFLGEFMYMLHMMA